MKPTSETANKAAKLQKIVDAARASFRIEGIHISVAQAEAALRKVTPNPDKASV